MHKDNFALFPLCFINHPSMVTNGKAELQLYTLLTMGQDEGEWSAS
jgi:hypothetical protein